MDIEQKAIKAVANVAAQAYRRAFDVKPDMTTGALAVMADAIAALDQPTLAPKIDKEDAIWRAIGSLAQRVRDLEQPTPEPDRKPPPPNELVGALQDPVHIPKVGRLISSTPIKTKPEPPKADFVQVGELKQPPSTLTTNGKEWQEASQPLPAEVESVFKDARSKLLSGPVTRIWTSDALDIVIAIQHRLAALWPKAGQVDEVTEAKLVEKWMQKNGWEWPVAGADCSDYDEAVRTVKWFMSHIQAGQVPSVTEIGSCIYLGVQTKDGGQTVDVRATAGKLRELLLSRMGQPAKPDKFDCDNCDVTDLRPVQPSPVTAEKLAEFIGNWLEPRMQTVWGYSDMAHAILQACPTLGQGRLTREQIETVLENEFPSYSQEYRSRVADDFMARTNCRTVSKEQWQKLLNHCHDNHNVSLWAIKEWLKEIGAEVEE